MRWCLFVTGCAWILTACAPGALIKKKLSAAESRFKDHIGFVLYDPETRKTLIEFNSGKYFTPASNTKIFTFYSSLQILGDSVVALKYSINGDSLIFWGTGDPSFLYQGVYNNGRTFQFLNDAPQRLFFSPTNFQTDHFGPGWAWDDYYYAYSAERSSFPVFGNLFEIEKVDDHWIVTPPMFGKNLTQHDSIMEESFIRDRDSNQIIFSPGRRNSSRKKWRLPFRSGADLTASLLSDTLRRKVDVVQKPLANQYQVLKSVPLDTLLKKMMQDSDNFIAEQLLLLCADAVSDTLNSDIAIQYAKKNFLFDLPDDPQWVDGSGLSRYNLLTPRSIVRLWEKVYNKVPSERLFKLLAVGSQSGTLKNWYQSDSPYIFGKTGSLSNNHTLSGFLITKKNRVLVFSFMNSNFVDSSDDVRRMMQEILGTLRNEY